MPGQVAGSESAPEPAFSTQFAANLYADLIDTLTAVGYTLGDTLFVAHYDWRRALAPDDGVADGFIDGVNADTITDDQIEYAIDDLGYWLDRASDRWSQLFGGDPPTSIDVIAHGHGGLIARAIAQSDASLGADVANNSPELVQRLPQIEQLIMLGSPNLGSAAELAIYQNQWVENDVYNALVAPTVNIAYQRLLRDGSIAGPAGVIDVASITDPQTAQPDEQRFIREYLLLTQSALPVDAVVDGATHWPVITEVSDAASSPPDGGAGAAVAPFQPRLSWTVPSFVDVANTKIYFQR